MFIKMLIIKKKFIYGYTLGLNRNYPHAGRTTNDEPTEGHIIGRDVECDCIPTLLVVGQRKLVPAAVLEVHTLLSILVVIPEHPPNLVHRTVSVTQKRYRRAVLLGKTVGGKKVVPHINHICQHTRNVRHGGVCVFMGLLINDI